jgi:hypothetical protein
MHTSMAKSLQTGFFLAILVPGTWVVDPAEQEP